MQNTSWPPAIPPPVLPTPDLAVDSAVRRGLVSVWLVGAGLALGAGAIGIAQLTSRFTLSFYNVILAVALVCEFAGLFFGITSRKTRIGRVGLVLSLLTLISVGILVLVSHAQEGNWPWQPYDCGCDGTG